MPSMSSAPEAASAKVSRSRGRRRRTWSRDASSGTTPPYSSWSAAWLKRRCASRPLASSYTATALSSQEDSMPRTRILPFESRTFRIAPLRSRAAGGQTWNPRNSPSRGFDAERPCPRERVFRRRPAAVQACLREGRHPYGAQAPGILREADAGTETQEGGGDQAAHEARFARRDARHALNAAPGTPVCRFRSGPVFFPSLIHHTHDAQGTHQRGHEVRVARRREGTARHHPHDP